MTDVQFLDVSEFNAPLDDSYPFPFVIFRTGDGTIVDAHAAHNLAWSQIKTNEGKMIGWGCYHVWRPDGDHGLTTLLSVIGSRHRPRMMIEWDIESWRGAIVGDHSEAIARTMRATVHALNAMRPDSQRRWWNRAYYRWQDRKRVRLYGNAGDLASIAPHATRRLIRLANYDTNPRRPKHWAHQYTSTGQVGKWHPVDMNSADGYDTRRLARRLGFGKIVERLP
jgi:hypothetical protein